MSQIHSVCLLRAATLVRYDSELSLSLPVGEVGEFLKADGAERVVIYSPNNDNAPVYLKRIERIAAASGYRSLMQVPYVDRISGEDRGWCWELTR